MRNLNTSTFENGNFDNQSFVLKQELKYILLKIIPLFFICLLISILIFSVFFKTYKIGGSPILYIINLSPILYCVYKFFYYKSYSYEITKERIIVKHGIIFINTSYQEMYRIEHYEKEENVFTKFLGVYNLKVEIREMNTERFIKIEGIGDYYIQLPHLLRELVQRAKVKYKAITLN